MGLGLGLGLDLGLGLSLNFNFNFTKEKVMLVLSRKKNESVMINNDITIVIIDIRGDKVRLGFDAPKDVIIHRKEVYDTIKECKDVENK